MESFSSSNWNHPNVELFWKGVTIATSVDFSQSPEVFHVTYGGLVSKSVGENVCLFIGSTLATSSNRREGDATATDAGGREGALVRKRKGRMGESVGSTG